MAACVDLISQLMEGAATRAKTLGRPLVTLSYAQSLDGSLATRSGQGLALSCAETKLLTHRLRAVHAGILVGIGTVLADDPSLTARLVGGPHPQPVILDRTLRLPIESRLAARRDLPVWVFCGPDAALERQSALEARGVKVLRVGCDPGGNLDLAEVLACLSQLGLASLMVEGGSRVLTSFLRSGLADQALITIAPFWAGGLPSVAGSLGRGNVFPVMEDLRCELIGRDLVAWGRMGKGFYETASPVFHSPTAG